MNRELWDKGKGNYLTSVAKQAKTAFLHGPTVLKSPIVGIEPATFRSESAALTTAPRDPTHKIFIAKRGNVKWGTKIDFVNNSSFGVGNEKWLMFEGRYSTNNCELIGEIHVVRELGKKSTSTTIKR